MAYEAFLANVRSRTLLFFCHLFAAVCKEEARTPRRRNEGGGRPTSRGEQCKLERSDYSSPIRWNFNFLPSSLGGGIFYFKILSFFPFSPPLLNFSALLFVSLSLSLLLISWKNLSVEKNVYQTWKKKREKSGFFRNFIVGEC